MDRPRIGRPLYIWVCGGTLAPEQKERVYQADYDRTWFAVLDVLNERVIPLTIVQKDSEDQNSRLDPLSRSPQ